jgi:hypothetical protein
MYLMVPINANRTIFLSTIQESHSFYSLESYIYILYMYVIMYILHIYYNICYIYNIYAYITLYINVIYITYILYNI